MSEVSLTPELQERLAGYAPITPKGEFVYVPRAYRERAEEGVFVIPQSEWPQFRCRELKSHELVEAPSVNTDSPEYMQQIGRWTLFCLRRGLVGWKNWKGADGKEVTFLKKYHPAGSTLTDEALELIPAPLIYEIGTAIASTTRLSEDELRGLGS